MTQADETGGRSLRARLASSLGQARRLLQLIAAGGGGFITVFLIVQIGEGLGTALLIAPFGASCVLVFALPESPLAQPRNVIGGHVISAAAGLLMLTLLGDGPIAIAAGVGLAISAMQATATLHPPAGANPIVVISAGAGWSFIAVPVLAGAVMIVLLALIYHRLATGRPYPLRP